MRRRSLIKGFLPAALVSGPAVLYAETYLTVEQAQRLLLPGASLSPASVTLSSAQKSAIEKASGVRVRETQIKAWRSGNGDWFIADNVVGKHEFIDFALALSRDGAVKGVEILTYRESYGSEVRNPKWRSQFAGKRLDSPVKIDKDIKNISGATLSSVHITEGVRRLLNTWAIALKS
ncbi:MAG: hypothetical protein JWO89_2536 [Verrucomicrobiaceae bacterium]|nr:hypothetical protein [Verrucomicrobiaceae bacterium]MDB6120605.1 hypothetical protein [Verrucomicrobiaceae bacterium]